MRALARVFLFDKVALNCGLVKKSSQPGTCNDLIFPLKTCSYDHVLRSTLRRLLVPLQQLLVKNSTELGYRTARTSYEYFPNTSTSTVLLTSAPSTIVPGTCYSSTRGVYISAQPPKCFFGYCECTIQSTFLPLIIESYHYRPFGL